MIKKRKLISIAGKIPNPILDTILITFPFLYKTKFVNFEAGTNEKQIGDLLKSIKDTTMLEGDIIECGSNRCGTSTILALYLKSNKINKKIFALDSFSGFDPEELKNERDASLTDMPMNAYNYNSYQYVIKKIKKLGITDILIPIKGFFQETLPKIDSKFCLAFIDCDLGESIKFTAENIWPELSSKGIMLFHDYDHPRFQNVKPFVDRFVDSHKDEIKHHKMVHGMYYVLKN